MYDELCDMHSDSMTCKLIDRNHNYNHYLIYLIQLCVKKGRWGEKIEFNVQIQANTADVYVSGSKNKTLRWQQVMMYFYVCRVCEKSIFINYGATNCWLQKENSCISCY